MENVKNDVAQVVDTVAKEIVDKVAEQATVAAKELTSSIDNPPSSLVTASNKNATMSPANSTPVSSGHN